MFRTVGSEDDLASTYFLISSSSFEKLQTRLFIYPLLSSVNLSGGMSAKDFGGYVAAQFLGGIAGAGILYGIISCSGIGPVAETGLGQNGYGDVSYVGLSPIPPEITAEPQPNVVRTIVPINSATYFLISSSSFEKLQT